MSRRLYYYEVIGPTGCASWFQAEYDPPPAMPPGATMIAVWMPDADPGTFRMDVD